MKINALLLMVTEDCNFSCTYCYQSRRNHYMTWQTAKQTLDYLSPLMKKTTRITFSGGEPFLAFPLIKKTVAYLKQKNGTRVKPGKFTITTNGSLINDEILDFLEQHRFRVDLSFDGRVQNRQRQKNSSKKIEIVIKKIVGHDRISFGINSTFTPATVTKICDSVEYIIGLGAAKISISLDLLRRWNRPSLSKLAGEVSRMRDMTIRYYRQTGAVPVTLFREDEEKGIWQCPAGSTYLAVTPSGDIWGCPAFYEYSKTEAATPAFREFYFGKAGEFTRECKKRFGEISTLYRRFWMENYYTRNSRCFLCPLIEKYEVCPILKKSTGHSLFYVPPYICEISKILLKERENFQTALSVS